MTATLLPDPEPRTRHYTIISVDDHLIEPADLFEGRMPAELAERAPRVVTLDNGRETWVYEDRFYPQVGLNAVAGRPKAEWNMEPARFDEMRNGCYDIDARVADMDLDGVYASVCFPSLIAGFAGTVFSASKDPELGLAALRAWNDWHIEEWAGAHPGPGHPAAARRGSAIRRSRRPTSARNAARGFKAVSFPENPVDLQLPVDAHRSLGSGACAPARRPKPWCASTTARRRGPRRARPARRSSSYTSLFPVNALVTAADWLWARVPTRFPNIKIAFSEGGISWVPMLIDRIDYVLDHSAVGVDGWDDPTSRRSTRCAATSGSARSTSARRSRSATTSASTTSARERLPACRLDVARHAGTAHAGLGDVLARRSPQAHVGERLEAVPPPRPAGAADPMSDTEDAAPVPARDAIEGRVHDRGRQRPDPRVPGGARRVSRRAHAGHVRRRACGVTRYEDVMWAFKHPEVFSSQDVVKIGNEVPLIPLSVDPPDHAKYRRLLDPQFSPKKMAELEPEMRKLVDEVIDGFIDRASATSTRTSPRRCRRRSSSRSWASRSRTCRAS